MPQPGAGTMEETVALFAPTAGDAAIATTLFSETRIPVQVYRSFEALIQAVAQGIGAVVLLHECLGAPELGGLERVLEAQPAWSSVPFVILTRPGSRLARDNGLRVLENAVFLERPIAIASFVSALRVALAARRRQYEIRDLLNESLEAAAERERLRQDAVKARAIAESANRMKDEFLAVVSHELRTPLNAIMGWASLLNHGTLDQARATQAVETIRRNAKVQAKLIEDLLDVSRIISGTLRLDMQQVDLGQILEQALGSIAPAAEAKSLQIVSHSGPGAVLVWGDPARLQQVIWNLLSNAVKFTPDGGRIQIVLEQLDSYVQLRISDSGQGIAAEFLQQIFERFRQVDSSTTRHYGGLGLGLSIVKQLVDLHGGRVVAESDGEGLGATFVVQLPLTASERRVEPPVISAAAVNLASQQPQSGSILPGLRVLIVDDEPDSLKVLAATLESHAVTVLTANCVDEALRLFDSRSVNAVICDIGMPQQDGYSFIQKMRAQEPADEHRVPAIALTAYTRAEDRARCLEAGFHAHLGKPVDPSELIALVASLTS